MKQPEKKPKDFYETPTVQDILPVTVVHGGDIVSDVGENDGNDDGDD